MESFQQKSFHFALLQRFIKEGREMSLWFAKLQHTWFKNPILFEQIVDTLDEKKNCAKIKYIFW